jgi:4-diphosphocytidyl-2-C-methyl-D-erythritol kinase
MAALSLSFYAPAKINLYLKITGQRTDGYHELETLMQKLALYDHLQFDLKNGKGINLDCGSSGLPTDERNIVYRAAQLFLEHTGYSGQGIKIVVRKNIPVAAGLGGGSSDAGAVLLALNELLATTCSVEELAALGLRLGADVPLFVHDMPAAWATGVGERLSPAIPLSGYVVVLVNPGIPVSTKWVYETFALTSGENIFNLSSSQKENSKNSAVARFCASPFAPRHLLNDLETVTAGKFSVISDIKEKMYAAGAAGTMMSGSGPTVFGLFAKTCINRAKTCCRELQQEYRQVYLVDPLTE